MEVGPGQGQGQNREVDLKAADQGRAHARPLQRRAPEVALTRNQNLVRDHEVQNLQQLLKINES